MVKFFYILMTISMMLVLASLVAGIFSMVKGGKFNEKHGNKMMRIRIYMQGLALLFFALAVWAHNSE
jgi:hypothetical protein